MTIGFRIFLRKRVRMNGTLFSGSPLRCGTYFLLQLTTTLHLDFDMSEAPTKQKLWGGRFTGKTDPL